MVEYKNSGNTTTGNNLGEFMHSEIKPPENGRYWVEFYNPQNNVTEKYQLAQREFCDGEWVNPYYAPGYVLNGWYVNPVS